LTLNPFSSDMDSGLSEGAIVHSSEFLAPPSLRGLVQRMMAVVFLFTAELIVISVWLDSESLTPAGLSGVVRNWGPWILRCIVGFAAIFVTFAYLKNKAELAEISANFAQTPIRWRLLAAHACAMATFSELSVIFYSGVSSGQRGSGGWANPLAVSWAAAGIAAIAFAALAFLPWKAWVQMIRNTGHLWAYSAIAILAACVIGVMCRRLWEPATLLTFGLTKLFLNPFVSTIVAIPARRVIGTPIFRVKIAPECSGLEGVGLILSFGILWLLAFRRECRFPQSLLLIPLGVVLLFLLNAVRIAALILIGNAGAKQIAMGGFHSQAGWIAFSAVSVGFCFVSQRVPWFTTQPPKAAAFSDATHNPTAAYLLPFAMILAAGMVATAAADGTGGFQWLYPLRFFAAAGALWIYRRSYASLNWKCDWVAPAIGAVVFVMWIALDRFSVSKAAADDQFAAVLMTAPAFAKAIWLSIRVLAAVVTVPVAEELAFRGFLMRRLISADFESVSLQRVSGLGLLVSSIVFGFLHGGYWIAGSIAGVLFGLAGIRRGRIGDAVMAHATANLLLAAYVLTYHKWHLW